MSVDFNADEILALAEQIERNGAAFYRHAAEIATDPAARETLSQLAEWEQGHETLFSSVRTTLQGAEATAPTFDPNDELMLYIRSMADRHVFAVHKSPTSILTGKETTAQVLDIAIGFERDSILLFNGLEAFVPATMGREKIAALVREEISHVAYLVRAKDRLAHK